MWWPRAEPAGGCSRVNLVVRNSRGLGFTPKGEQLVHEGQPLLARVDGLADNLSGGVFAGPLRVVAPFGFGRIHVAPIMAAFIRNYPQVRATLDLSEAPWSRNVEADVVIHIGTVRDSSWVAHLLARNARWVCASPSYLRRSGTAVTPSRAGAACLSLRSRKRRGRNAVALQKKPHIISAIRGASNKSGTHE